ncbi:hypothetical protein [Chitinophaga pinensis]|uniref:hypothetical protein n=1 Tax=Chitinophaga pinensis TaxID=79329 RepID=UPI001C992505|nr:hypothetical protein [Chitinophaga pinensis]
MAERNGGVNAFYGIWDMRIANKIKIHKTHFVELSADFFNIANMIKKDWGTIKTLGKQNLYSIGGFDKDTRSYVYNVNVNSGVIVPSGNPWQIQFGIRYGF